jgi:hypothetical protein
VDHEEVPKEDAAITPVGEPRKRRRERNLDARRRRKQQERTQSKDGCRKNLVSAHRGTTCCAEVARRRTTLFTKETREYRGSRKRLAVARRWTTRCAAVARRRGDLVRKSQTGNDVAGGALRERTPGKRRRVVPECNTGIKEGRP